VAVGPQKVLPYRYMCGALCAVVRVPPVQVTVNFRVKGGRRIFPLSGKPVNHGSLIEIEIRIKQASIRLNRTCTLLFIISNLILDMFHLARAWSVTTVGHRRSLTVPVPVPVDELCSPCLECFLHTSAPMIFLPCKSIHQNKKSRQSG
jgi:hypothetical protein